MCVIVYPLAVSGKNIIAFNCSSVIYAFLQGIVLVNCISLDYVFGSACTNSIYFYHWF